MEWKNFNNIIDDVIPLSKTNSEASKGLMNPKCHRVSTRGSVQAQSSISDPKDPKLSASNWAVTHTPEELVTLQRQDHDLVIIHDWLDRQEQPNQDSVASYSPDVHKLWLEWDNLHRIEGVLYLRWIEENTQQRYNRLVVPHKLREEFITLCHTSVLSGHLRIDKTVKKIQQNAYWRTLRSDVKIFIQKCPVKIRVSS